MAALSEEYADITPVVFPEHQPQLCQILYDDEYRATMGTLLALLAQNEYSERALALTQAGIELLASHYTIWNYRFNIIVHLKKDLFQELGWCEQIALDNEKNYQIWNYRQLIIEQIMASENPKFNPYHEYPILASMLEEDTKNHHVWLYRKWLVQRFDMYKDPREIAFVDGLILQDVRNNSAWTHRFFIMFHNESVTDGLIDSEIDYVTTAIRKSPQNASTWNYLRGIYRQFGRDIVELEPLCEEYANIDPNSDPEITQLILSSHALELLAEIYHKKEQLPKARMIYTLLASEYDPVRKNYWEYRARKV